MAVFAQEVKLLVSNMCQSIRFPCVIGLVNHTADMFTSSTYVFRTGAIQREAATNNDVLGILILRIGTSEKHQRVDPIHTREWKKENERCPERLPNSKKKVVLDLSLIHI